MNAPKPKNASIKEQLEVVRDRSLRQQGAQRRASPRATRSAPASPRCGANSPAEYGFVVPEICTFPDDIKAPPKTYLMKIRMHAGAEGQGLPRHHRRRPDRPAAGHEVREPAFGIRAIAIPEAFVKAAKREGFKPIDLVSALLTPT